MKHKSGLFFLKCHLLALTQVLQILEVLGNGYLICIGQFIDGKLHHLCKMALLVLVSFPHSLIKFLPFFFLQLTGLETIMATPRFSSFRLFSHNLGIIR
jgi:hypothetical protein